MENDRKCVIEIHKYDLRKKDEQKSGLLQDSQGRNVHIFKSHDTVSNISLANFYSDFTIYFCSF